MLETVVALILLAVATAVTSFFCTGIVKRAAEHIGLVDRPDERKLHPNATPRLGGLAIIFGFAFPLLLLSANGHAERLVSHNLSYLFAVLASGSLVIGLGVYDDLIGADAPRKFIVQTAAAAILVGFGFQFENISIAGHEFHLGALGSVFSILWLVGVINAVNFIDGMDSLATVIALTIAVAFAVIAVIRDDAFSLVTMVALAGALIGFYPWNKPPAKIFMGDSGSLFIGLILGAISLARSSKSPAALALGGPIIALALPVLDTLIVMKQRLGGRATPLGARLSRMVRADRKHIHHILVARFGSPGKAIASIWLVTTLFAISAVLTVTDRFKMWGYTMALIGLALLLLLRYGRGVERDADGDARELRA